MKLELATESWPYKVPFRIARGAEAALEVIVVTLTDGAGRRGRGEAAGVDHHGETCAQLVAQVESVRSAIEGGLGFDELAAVLPPGGARNAVDCALWDLRAKQIGARAWELAGMRTPHELVTAVTLGMDTDAMLEQSARRYRHWPLLKIKVDGQRPLEPLRLVRRAAPDAALIVDPNQSWTCDLLNRLEPELKALGVVLIEQPVAVHADDSLAGYVGSIRLAADESVSDRATLAAISAYYQVVNIKLDKSGGLTEALALALAARDRGLGIMVGCMAGTSLAMAPGMIVGQLAEFVDLDGPLLHASDRTPGIVYERGRMALPPVELWG